MKNDKCVIDIVYPDGLSELSPNSLLLCEGFISRLFDSNASEVNIRIDAAQQNVESNVSEIKNYIFLLIKSGSFSDFMEAFLPLLHVKKEYPKEKMLLCVKSGERVVFLTSISGALPKLSINIIKAFN